MKKLSLLYITILIAVSCNNNEKPMSRDNEKMEKATIEAKPVRIKNILFFGNSLTAGYGLDDPSEAFPALIQQKIDSLELPYKVINAGLSGETTSGGKGRVDWLLKQQIDVFVLELGANDGLRGIPVAETSKNLQAIVDKVKTKYPGAKLVMLGMEVPPNMGGTYASQFRVIFRQIAEKNNMTFVPFLLEGVAGSTELNLKDGIHPTAEGYQIVAENVWEKLEGILTKLN